MSGTILDQQQTQNAGQVILNAIKRRALRRGLQGCGGWLDSPANLQLFALAVQRLLELAQARHVDLGPEQKVTKLRAARKTGDNRVWLYPTDWDDPQGIPLKEQSRRMAANLYDFMAEAGWLVEIGHSERFALQDAKPEDPVGENALWFDVTAPLERKVNSKGRAAARSKAKKAQAKTEAAAKAKVEMAAGPKPEAGTAAQTEVAATDEPKAN